MQVFALLVVSVGFGMLTVTSSAAKDANEPKVGAAFTIATGLKIDGVEFGGLSGLEYDTNSKRFIAISDDRALKGPARFYELDIKLDERGVGGVEVVKSVHLRDVDGRVYPFNAVDPEEIRILPNGNMVWSDEGTMTGQGIAIIESDRQGKAVAKYELPNHYLPSALMKRGVRSNKGHEALAVSPDGKKLVAIVESALKQDGGAATLAAGSPVRMLVFDTATRTPLAEYVYKTEAIPTASPRLPPVHDNGVSSAIYLSDGRLLVMERSFAAGVGNTIQIFDVDVSSATNTLGTKSLAGRNDVVPVSKRKLLVLKSGENGRYIDNLEGMAEGPNNVLLLVSDNNFGSRQTNQFVPVYLNPKD